LTISRNLIKIEPREKLEEYSMKKIISTILCLFILLSCILPTMAATGVPEEVMESTMTELADYKETIDEIGIGPTIDLINEEIDRNDE
jgi:hypothetical protein